MLQALEKDLREFHKLFQGGRCQAWQIEELIAKAIRSDFSKIIEFLNQSLYLIVAVPYYKKDDENGRSHIYQIIYMDARSLKINNDAEFKMVGKKLCLCK